ncbi:protein kinase [Chitinophaga sp. CC14]|uniref:protein kinase domain-containing protein n=1 Tax=Chitinophaga sp. CC14 TaxID=3029199 RepID=UPI003B7DFEB8
MEANKEIVYRVYSTLLDRLGLDYVEEGPWLIHGTPMLNNNWVLYISVKIAQVAEILKRIMPEIKNLNVSFRLIKDDEQAYELNTGQFDFHDVGKFLTVYCSTEDVAKEVVKTIESLTQDYLGAEVPYSLRVGKNIYAHWATLRGVQDAEVKEVLSLEVPNASKIPFSISRKYRHKGSKKWYGWFYLKDKILRPGPKGEVFLAYSLKSLQFKEVVIKEGRHCVFEDFNGRDIKDRFSWQKKVLVEVGNYIPTAKYVDYFEENGNYYLVIENLKGQLLPKKVEELKSGESWVNLSPAIKKKILNFYKQILGIVAKLHELGYVHRDIQDHNFIVDKNDNLSIIDFELSYNTKSGEPEEPFLLGTLGYVAPEQINLERPTEQVDMYSLGALLAFLIVGEHPSTMISKEYEEVYEKINKYSDSNQLTGLINNLLNPDPTVRPNMLALEHEINKYIEDLQIGKIKSEHIKVHPYEN